MKRFLALLACIALAFSAIALSSCGIISDLYNAVNYPESYTLAYEATSADGTIVTIVKTVDGNGNVYYKNADVEIVYILEGSGFIKYEKNEDGIFEKTSDVKLTKSAVENETSGINTYAEKSLNKFMPTAKQESDVEMLGRICEVYKLGVGNESNSSYTYHYVDKETGICLGVETKNTALGTAVPHNGESFICIGFSVADIADVSVLVAE
jgi:hypothetical protein